MQVYVGGANADWPVPEEGDEDEEELLGLDDDEDDEGTEVDPDERIARLLTGKRGGGRKRRGAGARGADPFEFTGEGRVSDEAEDHVTSARPGVCSPQAGPIRCCC
jgi:hypothetical protein